MKQHGMILICIFLGGALGTLFRYIINIQVEGFLFPLGTVIENLVGSFLLGGLTGYILHKKLLPGLKEGIGVGFCGGFTTMSTLAADSVFLVLNNPVQFFIYMSVSLFGGLLLALVGMMLSTAFIRKRIFKVGGDQ
ncbi:CrcB protein [Evansella vedderi]|uniref:Fluoride-specific ion channel FluC n=1 Tax=Evansella vedderi TaxID=38282 RepID=A0ABT9ZXX4_9BACI|nr:CrcB family protein [Evansella vedderi]MDQ0256095.1 CrcB protein [Evansella vedderi]